MINLEDEKKEYNFIELNTVRKRKQPIKGMTNKMIDKKDFICYYCEKSGHMQMIPQHAREIEILKTLGK